MAPPVALNQTATATDATVTMAARLAARVLNTFMCYLALADVVVEAATSSQWALARSTAVDILGEHVSVANERVSDGAHLGEIVAAARIALFDRRPRIPP